MTLPAESAAEVIARLSAARTAESVLTFDGDGTLWSGDVAEDVFCHATDHGLLKGDASEELGRVARQHGISSDGTASEIARRVFDEYVAGRFPELSVCEVMTWCFAGFSPDELSELARDVLDEKGLDARLHRELEPIFDWARRHGVKTLVISASPRPIVEQAAKRWGISSDRIAASTPAVEAGRIVPRLHSPVPYAKTKVELGRALIGAASWLGAFGDSGFDADMLSAATVPVAVRPKPSLRERAAEIRGLVRLIDSSAELSD